jgi:voltage-dependent potassium channel beta subunit
MTEMEYRRLGRAGLQVSVLSFGSWVTFGPQLDVGLAADCMGAAFDGGCNFFDNAEGYAAGESERIMGKAIERNGWARHDYVVSSKFYWGLHDGPNNKNTLNRKYLQYAVPAACERMGLDFLDLVFCHRPDPNTPVEETVEAMTWLIERGYALYWGTSEWAADDIRAAYEIAERRGLAKPSMEQPGYNLLNRRKVEKEFTRLYEDWGMGLTTWSPLASGMLTGKYLDGIPEGSRASLKGYEWLQAGLTDPSSKAKVQALVDLAGQLDCTPAQLAIAWCAKNPNVSTVITGASRPEQVVENFKALDVLARLDATTMAALGAIK